MARLRIKEIAIRQNLKQYELAEKSGVGTQLLNRYWNNRTNSVSLEHLTMIAKALGVKTSDLIADEEQAKRGDAA